MRLRVTALDYLGGALVLQTDGGLLPWPSSTQGHAPGAEGELVFSAPEQFRSAATEVRFYSVEQKGPLALLRDDAGLATALMLPPGKLDPRVAVELVMPDVEVSEGAENDSAPAKDACPCPNLTPELVAASSFPGSCPT